MNPSILTRLLVGALFIVSSSGLMADPANGQIKTVQGTAYLISPSGKSHQITEGMEVPPGSTIRTTSDGTVGLHLLPGGDTVVGPGTTVVISSDDYTKTSSDEADRKMRLNLKKGTVFFNLVHGDGSTDFRVNTPKGVAAARGTRGSITVTVDDVKIKLAQGSVVFTFPDGRTLTVPAGYGCSVSTGQLTKLSAADLRALVHILVTFAGIIISGNNPGGGGGGGNGGAGGGGGNLNPGNGVSPDQ